MKFINADVVLAMLLIIMTCGKSELHKHSKGTGHIK
jgi:hypothetical protein